MIEHVYRRTAMCTALDDIFAATCDQEIMDAVNTFGGKAIMTLNDKYITREEDYLK